MRNHLVIIFHNDIQQGLAASIKVVLIWRVSLSISFNDLTVDTPLTQHKVVHDGLGGFLVINAKTCILTRNKHTSMAC